MKASVYRKEHFNAAHRLHNPSWSDEKNKEIFGLCNNNNYHGHNYEIVVKVTGPIDPDTGYVIDAKVLKQFIRSEITDKFDHKNLNLDTEEFKQINPTAENIAAVCWQKLKKQLPDNLELTIILYETERNFVEFNGQ